MKNREEILAQFSKLLDVMDDLRAKCPWDKEQTMESIRSLTIEETFELSDAIIQNDLTEVKKELGDLLLHIVFYSKIASETETFDVGDVIESLIAKLIRRHPHIYGDVEANDADKVKQNWEQIKLQEKGTKKNGILDGVPKGLTGIVKAYRMQEKASQVGFDWNNAQDAYKKVEEEWKEFEEAESNKEKTAEFGDYLFALVNYARLSGIHPDDALELTNQKFLRRFKAIEAMAEAQRKGLQEMNLQEMDALWDKIKLEERGY
ncbi:MAG: nucleoside triphosphate pyrophosphohydrolase [Bacteroidota bacterium]